MAKSKFTRALFGLALFTSSLLFGMQPASGQSANPFNPDYAWCATRGSVVTRTANKWGCLLPGTAGQVLRSGGAGADASWLTVTGTGTVTSVGLAMPTELTITGSPVTTAGTLTGAWATQTTNKIFAAPSGSTGVPTFRAMVAADLPNAGVANGSTISGTFPTLNVVASSLTNTQISNTAAIALSKLATIPDGRVLANITGATASPSSNTVPAILDYTTFTSGTGILRKTGVATYTAGTTVSVAEGGTGQTTGNGTSLDNISGMAGTGIVRRTGAGAYTQGTTVATAEIADGSITTVKLATPAASGASSVLLGSVTASGADTMALAGVLSSAYTVYNIELANVRPGTTCSMVVQFGNGGTYQTATYAYGIRVLTTAGTETYTGGIAGSGVPISGNVGNGAVNGGISASATLTNPSDATMVKGFQFQANAYDGSVYKEISGFGKYIGGANAFTDIRLTSTGGVCNFASGTMYVYGIRPS